VNIPLPFSFKVNVPKGCVSTFYTTLPGVLDPLTPDLVNDRWITSIELFAGNGWIGDSFVGEIVDKDGVLGSGPGHILDKFYDDISALTFSEGVTIFNGVLIRPNEWYETKFEPSRIPAGATLKLKYHSIGIQSDVNLYGVIHWGMRS